MSVDTRNGPFSNEEQLFDDESSGSKMSGIIFKKGPWTSAEDAILTDYVNKHGEGNWTVVQKHSGLFRCGKSCRLRWVNHLRPNLKKGPFTAEEERMIIELQAKMGNKWTQIASHSSENLVVQLPGRTDNDVKNYWNTEIKRRRRTGLSLYSQEACLQDLLDSKSDDPMMMNKRPNGYSSTNSYDDLDVTLHSMSTSHDSFSYFPELAAESPACKLFEAIGLSRQSNFVTSQEPKRYCGSRSGDCGSEVIVENELFPIDAAQGDPPINSSGFIFPYDHDLGDHNMLLGVIQDSHSFVNGNFSTPKPACVAVKSELPSFQYPDTDSSNWDTFYSASPLLEPNETDHSEHSSPHNSGLLDALLYEARTISGVKNQSSKKSSNSSAVTPIDFAEEIGLKFCKTEIRNICKPVSPLDSATSIYSGSAFTAPCGTLMDSHPFVETYSEHKVKCDPIDNVNNPFEENISATFDFLDPLMSSYINWLEKESYFTVSHTTMEETVAEAMGSRFIYLE